MIDHRKDHIWQWTTWMYNIYPHFSSSWQVIFEYVSVVYWRLRLLVKTLPFSGLCSCACKRSWKLKRLKPAPTEAPLSHRKRCSWNTSSVVPPLIPWLGDTKSQCHTFASFYLAASLAYHDWFSTAALLLLLAVLGQACVSWPVRAEWVFQAEGAFKRRGSKQTVSDECFLKLWSLDGFLKKSKNLQLSLFAFFCEEF